MAHYFPKFIKGFHTRIRERERRYKVCVRYSERERGEGKYIRQIERKREIEKI